MSIGAVVLLAIAGLPASFTGDLPCADCEALRYHVDLFEDGTYFRRVVYVGKAPHGSDEIGKWALSEDGTTVTLSGGERFERRDDSTLRKLDREGEPIDSTLNYDLVRGPVFAPIEPELALMGTYARGHLTECTTGLQLPVAREGANAMLEAAYTRVQPAAGATVFVAVHGKIAMRVPVGGDRPTRTLVVTTLQTVGVGDCATAMSTALAASLEDTYWKLVHLGGQAVVVPDEQREPHLILQSLEQRVIGFTGCNRMTGEYKLDGERLEFDGVAGTMMACPEAMDSERAFHRALRRTFEYRISGDHLTLLDANGKPLAELQSK